MGDDSKFGKGEYCKIAGKTHVSNSKIYGNKRKATHGKATHGNELNKKKIRLENTSQQAGVKSPAPRLHSAQASNNHQDASLATGDIEGLDPNTFTKI